MKKIISAILSGMLIISCIPTSFASENTSYAAEESEITDCEVYEYDFEKEATAASPNVWRESTAASSKIIWCAYSGASVSQKIGGIGENTSNVAKVEKTDINSRCMYLNVLGNNIRYKNASDTARYFKFDFKIYTSGEGVEYAAPCGTWQDAWAAGVSVKGSVPSLTYENDLKKPIPCLEKNSWNSVTYIIRPENKHKIGNYIYFDTYSDIYVNGVQVAENREYTNARSITIGMTDDNHIKLDFMIMGASGKNFTAYIDDLSLRVYEKNILKNTQKPEIRNWEKGGEQAYYLADEDFLLTKGGTNQSTGELDISAYSWKLISDGGFLQNYDTDILNYVPMRLNDTENNNHIALQKNFAKQYNSKITTEYRLSYDSLQSSGSGGVSLCRGNDNVLSVYDKNGALWCGSKKLDIELEENTEYGIRLETDMNTGYAKLYIGGILAAENIGFASDYADNIRVWTTDEYVGKMMFCPVRITCGYYVYEDFVSYSENQLLSAGYWNTSGTLKIEKIASHTQWDMYALKMENGSEISKNAECGNDEVILSYNLFSAADINSFEVCGLGINQYINEGKFYARMPDGEKEIKQLDKNVWNSVRIKINFKEKNSTVYINGKAVCEGMLNSDLSQSISFKTGENTSAVYIDDIMLFAAPLIDEFYPTEPKTAKDDDAIVGVQTCDLWREGKHYGWESINKYHDRKPYIGFYDDGSVEAKDWEIKYMAENGIDFAMYTWFAPNGTNGSAIKEPRYVGKSIEAYFNSEYKDKVKLAIMWENSAYRSYASTDEAKYAQCLEHFKNVLVPYWTEYYFTDPDYMKADGKLIFSIYKLDRLVSSFGKENAKAAVSFLRQYVRDKTGLDMYVFGCTASETRQNVEEGWSSYDNMKDYKEFGFDAIYPYSYSAGQTTFGRQYDKIMALEANETEISNAPKSVPTVSMGRDPEAWTGDKGTFLTPKAFEELLRTVKENYLKGGAEQIDNMIFIDNWNEYGEGHFIAPTGIAGFGYVEAISRVFNAAEHINEKPKYPQRFGHLYSADGVETEETKLRWNGEFNSVTRWDFDSSTEEWTGKNVIGLKASNGTLSGRSSYLSGDPYILSPKLNIKLDGTEVIHARFRNGASDSATTELFFKTENSDSFSQSVPIYCLPTKMESGQWVDVYFDMSSVANDVPICSAWKNGEVLTQLRIDPHRSSNSAFEYDYIEILRASDSKKNFYAAAQWDNEQGGTEFIIENPDYRRRYTAWLAEYERGSLTNIEVRTGIADVGNTKLSIPYVFKSGREYKSGLWDENSTPLISPVLEYSKSE